jgi:hypothetical protein
VVGVNFLRGPSRASRALQSHRHRCSCKAPHLQGTHREDATATTFINWEESYTPEVRANPPAPLTGMRFDSWYNGCLVPFNPGELAIHYARHRHDFQVATIADYERLADGFLAKPKSPQLLECTRRLGDFVRYDTITMEFAVRSANGVTRTYFKPRPCSSIPVGLPRINCHGHATNEIYFAQECLKWQTCVQFADFLWPIPPLIFTSALLAELSLGTTMPAAQSRNCAPLGFVAGRIGGVPLTQCRRTGTRMRR